ncbi:MAG: PucR family transcriptional regulator ligand-binding domain-containing protein [Solirubrobacterales bacterium]|nr:PucR family transcriptional regulator ligand-binding domain-containing protein [Solirubrobacterales bacterium]
MLTLRDLLRDLDVRVLAGESGLDAHVRWVHISELLDPTPWLSGGELLLTTGMPLESEQRQREYVARLADHQLSGLGFGTGFGHVELPAAVLEAAEEREFPVFEVPYELPFIAVTEAAFTRLVNEQYAVLRRALAAHERLERIVLSERGLDALAGTLATLIGGAVLVLDARGEPLAQRTFRRSLAPDSLTALQEELRERARRREARSFLPSEAAQENRGLALPVAADGAPGSSASDGDRAPEAWLVALKDSGPLSDFDRLTLHHAVTIVALELLRGRVAGDTERRLAGDVLAAVVSGELAGGDLARRLEPFGLSERVAAIVLVRPNNGRGSSAPLESTLATALREEAAPGLIASTGSLTCALVRGLAESELFALAERVSERLSSALGVPLRVGVGRAVASGEARRSFHEARCALEAVALGAAAEPNGAGVLGAQLPGGEANGLATYRDLGSFQLLLSLQEDEALRLFCDSILGPIETSEGQYGGELMRSLEAFIEENGQWERAARRLFCHRHTLRYRIRRVEELTGRNLGNARDRIEFWLALRGRELVR